ncbi:AAA family ATPase [Desulfobacterales bacterium HSG2]|nr:AAA family ATPase [Desulfobacterales bacterium HSG2]
MITVPNYKIITKIYESANSLVYRARRDRDGLPVVLKVLKEDYPTPEELTRYRQEYDITRSLADSDGIVNVHSLEKYRNTLLMCLEDFGGESLKIWTDKRRIFTLDELLTFAIRAAEILGQIHGQNIIHKDINPSNIILNSASGVLKIIDFGISTRLSRQHLTLRNPDVLEGTLAYISPEQTGRMNRALDYRTDFYSLGATFYELFTGKVPFESEDAMELVHCHIARHPAPPRQINPDLPCVVSDIILKLLEKTAEARYQSAWGIKADLEECKAALQKTGTVEPFALARKDIPDRFQIPEKLYGREHETDTLLAAFERVADGGAEIMMVAGYSGIGKSVLVREIYRSLTRRQGCFISGKFDQLHRNIPYSAVVSAFRELARQLLTENEERLSVWREKLLSALGPNGQVIIDVIPEIGLITGPRAAVPRLRPAESQNRFNLVFRNFMRVFCQPEHPLVIFLDDLQWADLATLRLLELVMADSDNTALFLIGAYRDNEVDPAHPLMKTLDSLREEGTAVSRITLEPLASEHVSRLIADSLHQSLKAVGPLTDLVMRKTGGNPFFVNQFLHTLYEEELLVFEKKKKKTSEDFGELSRAVLKTSEVSQYGWQWDTDRIEAVNITDNVVELMIGKLRRLPESARQVLRLAACAGSRFDLDTLSVIYEKPAAATFQDLTPALTEGLVLPLSEPEMAGDDIRHSPMTVSLMHFLHDRVQQAAYALIDDDRKQAVRLQIGRLMLKNTPADAYEEKVFDIAGHFNHGIDLLRDPAERLEVARLNLTAGRKAKTAGAHGAAVSHLAAGRECLPENSWESEYDLTLTLLTEAAEAAYLSGDFEQTEQLTQAVLRHARTLSDEAKICEISINAQFAQSQLREAIKTALTFLDRLGVSFPEEPTQEDVGLALRELRVSLAGRPIRSLTDLPMMTDSGMMSAMRVAGHVVPATYQLSPTLYALMTLKLTGLSIEYGNHTGSDHVYSSCGVIHCGVVGDIESGCQFGQLALDLLRRFGEKGRKVQVIFVYNCMIRVWKEHLRAALKPLTANYQTGLEIGEITYASFSVTFCTGFSYFVGKRLVTLEQEMALYSPAVARYSPMTLSLLKISWQAVLNLMGRSDNPCHLTGDAYDENVQLPVHQQANQRMALCFFHLNKCVLHYLFREYASAVRNAETAEQYLDSVTSTVFVAVFHFYDSLARLAVYPGLPRPEQEAALAKVSGSQEKMRHWADHAPMNFQHKHDLVEAEKARVLGRNWQAAEFYDKAVELAHENEYVNEEALACELAGRFYLAKGKSKIAHVYLRDAQYAYQQWGATAKVKDLETGYPQFPALKTARAIPTDATVSPARTTVSTSTKGDSEWLDLNSIMKAAQTLSGEIVLSRLLEKMMHIVIENAGAEKGFLLLPGQDSWLIEAQGHADSSETIVLQSSPLEESGQVSADIVHYVARTRENVVLHNATQEGGFTRDAHIVRHRPVSVLCAPLLTQGQLTGILYLENNLTTDAFTSERVEVLSVLVSQAAISVENARLYARLRESEQKYRNIFENATEGIFQTTEDGRVLTANPALAKMSGYDSPEDFIKNVANIGEQIYVDSSARDEFLKSVKEHGFVKDFEFRAYRKDGSIIDASTDAHAVRDDNQNLLYFEGLLRDITQKKRLEELKIAKEAADAANRAKSDFLANMSHELRTPLNSILGYAHILKQNEDPDSRRFGGLNIIQQSGEHLLTLISDILELSKIEAGRLELIPAEVYLPGFLNTVADMSRVRAEQKNLMFVCEFAPELPAGVLADEKRLRQVLLNLLGNALEYTDRGQVAMRVSVVSRQLPVASCRLPVANSIGPRTTDNGQRTTDNRQPATGNRKPSTVNRQPATDKIRFEIEDTGIGIASEQMEKIFQPFEQAGDMLRRESGTGLGLAISRRLVRMMGGEIEVRSEPGRGSVFRFDLLLPVVEAEAAEQTGERRVTGYTGPRRKILIADDLPSNSAVLRDWLTPLGFDTTEAEDGEEAVELAQAVRPDLILMDLRMPVMNGFEAAGKMRRIPALSDVIIIAVSAGAYDTDRERSLAAGCDDFLPKPVRWGKLEAMMEKYLNLEWKYETEEESPEPSSLIPPPPEETAVLYDLAMMGNIKGIRERADHLEALGEAFIPFARKLRKMARSFEIEAILALVEQYADKETEK